MKDEHGLYYLPEPGNTAARMYVRYADGEILFRLMDKNVPEVWERHGWIPFSAVKQAVELYGDKGPKILKMYDLDVAMAILEEDAGRVQ